MMNILEVNTQIKNKITKYNTEYLNLIEIKCLLERTNEINFVNCGVTPFFFPDSRVYELYAYALIICDKHESLEEFVLSATSKKRIEDIPPDVYDRTIHCLSIEPANGQKVMLAWIKWLLTYKEFQNDIKEVSGSFDPKKIYVEIWEF